MSAELQARSAEMIPALEEEIRLALHATEAGRGPTDPFLGMLHYHMGWADEQLQPHNGGGGKRIRPLLCLLTCQAAGGQWRQALPAAAALEILHNFSLIHDDIEDASPARRGRLTVWKIWGVEQAINSGDAMFALAHLALARLADRGVPPATVVEALRRFDLTCIDLTRGQHADMTFEQRAQVTVAEYVDMIGGKTAALLSLAAELGALVAGADREVVAHYARFGLELGLAFQIIDDILGIWGDESRTGKSAATDIATKKKTLPVLDGLSRSERLRRLYVDAAPDNAFVAEVIGILDEIGAYEFAVAQAANHSQSALKHLDAAAPAGVSGRALRQLTAMLLQRDF